MRLGQKAHIGGRRLYYRSTLKDGRRRFWCPLAREVVTVAANVTFDKRRPEVQATETQRRLAQQVGLSIREVLKLT